LEELLQQRREFAQLPGNPYRLYRLSHCSQIEHESQSLAKMFR
jgi:hypothetical protein